MAAGAQTLGIQDFEPFDRAKGGVVSRPKRGSEK
jgi:hypothetical protein